MAERSASLAMSERAEDRCILIPLYSDMTDDEQDRVVDALGDALRTAITP